MCGIGVMSATFRFTNRARNFGRAYQDGRKTDIHSPFPLSESSASFDNGEDAKTKGRMGNLPNYFQKRIRQNAGVDILDILSNPKRTVLVLMM